MKTVDLSYIKCHMPPRPDDAHKGTMGTLCSITGSYGFAGAAMLSARAALRSGVGLVYQVLPRCIYPIFAGAVVEAVCVPAADNAYGTFSAAAADTVLSQLERASAVLIGCGMGNCPDTYAVLEAVLRHSRVPVIIDADGINALAPHIDIIDRCACDIILTPHPREFSRLSGIDTAAITADPAKAATDFAAAHPGVTLALKGHRTYIAHDDELFVNTAGNSGMAKGGSGDVLAGIIASLAAQGAKPYQAAVMGVHIHALGGDIAAHHLSRTAMLPGDIIAALPEVYLQIEHQAPFGKGSC